MYDRAPRKFNFQAASGTEEGIGPGAYDNFFVSKAKIRSDGYAPFGSLSTRDHFMTPADAVVAAPGPGQYDAPAVDHIPGGASLMNRSRRFGSGKTVQPGPGSYNLPSKWIKEERYSTADASRDKSGQIMVTSRVKYQRKADAPSIPVPSQAYGYEEAEDGTLIRQDPPNNDRSLGPAYYPNAAGDETATTRRYRGCHWSKAKAGRSDFAARSGVPGPGEYDPFAEQEAAPKLVHVNMTKEGSKPHDLKLPRYSDAVVEKAIKNHIPGPGSYDIRGGLDPTPPKVNQEGLEVERPPFGSQAQRFGSDKGGNPGPGSYNDPRHALSVVNRTSGLKRSPFGQTSVRFQEGQKRMPGPGAYRIPGGIGARSERQIYMSSFRRGAFGSTASRAQATVKKGDVDQPGPASYAVHEKPHKPRYGQHLTAPFASLSTRNPDPPEEREKPAPGCYEVARSFHATQDKKMPRAPRTDAAKKRNESFATSADRFAPPKDPEYPGPGTYEVKGRVGGPGGKLTVREPRFKAIAEEVPGPAHYELSPFLAHTVLKGTYNATLNNPLLDGVEKSYGLAPTKQGLALGV